MAFSQVKDILKRAVEFHKMLEGFYANIENASEKQNVKLLVNYMARHEKVLEEQLGKVAAAQAKQINEEWLKYEPEFATCRCFEDLKIDNNSSADDVIEAGLVLNQCLINLYRQMSVVAPSQETKTLFSSLEVAEVAEKKKLARMKGM